MTYERNVKEQNYSLRAKRADFFYEIHKCNFIAQGILFKRYKSSFKLTRIAFGGIDEDQSHINNRFFLFKKKLTIYINFG